MASMPDAKEAIMSMSNTGFDAANSSWHII
jgi:hypothetical protein